MGSKIEKSRRNQSLNKSDITNQSGPAGSDENRSRSRTTGGSFEAPEMDSNTFKRDIRE